MNKSQKNTIKNQVKNNLEKTWKNDVKNVQTWRFWGPDVDLEDAPFPAPGRFFSIWFSNPPRGYPQDRFWCHFGRQFGPKLRFCWPLLTSFESFGRHVLSKSLKNGAQNHETNIKIAKASSQMRIWNYMSTIQKISKHSNLKKKQEVANDFLPAKPNKKKTYSTKCP